MPPLGTRFCSYVDGMLTVCTSIEVIREASQAGSLVRRELTYRRLGHIYEAAYLRIFSRWETFLEEACLRYMVHYHSPIYTPVVLVGGINTLSDARAALYGGGSYLLWHDPARVAARAAAHLSGCPIETVTNASIQSLNWMAAVRHRVAHDSDDARSKFDAATMSLAGQRYPGGRPGLFLRSTDSAHQRWLPLLAIRLKNLALQIAP